MVKIGKKSLSLADFDSVLFGGSKIEVDAEGKKRIKESFDFLESFSSDKMIYGINTGFGPMAPCIISEYDQHDLQYNLIRSHCSGSGSPISDVCVKAMMLARLNTLAQGNSGIHPEVTELLTEFINKGINPVIYEHGGVGASGDLVQLAHLALSLIGEGEVSYKGEIIPTKKALEENNLTPISIHFREGLGLMNGTSTMTGIGITNLIHSKNLFDWSVVASSFMNEIVEAYDDHFSEELNRVKHHKGQNIVAQVQRAILHDSSLTRKRDKHLYDQKVEAGILKDKVQEYYSIRCVPQILGPVFDTLETSQKILEDEVNSANDNPIIDVENQNVFHGGNFHGDYVALEMDKLKIAITKLSMLSERQLNYLLNHRLNRKLPPFINLGQIGLNFGMQGLQFTATSTVAENQTLANPVSIHSISCNNDNQDIVSMGANAALMAKKVIDNSFEVQAIEMMAIVQAVDYLQFPDKLSSFTRKIYDDIRQIVPKFKNDTPKYNDIRKVKNHLLNNKLNLQQLIPSNGQEEQVQN
ncbi:MAG: histidine ammonia-lyase [Flavobacteriales bacterium]|nr:MAG: histidine ammonia-lyase [Flavobacteriales bacterium]